MSGIDIREHNLTLPGLGVQTRVLEAGQGPSVLMLHGNPDNADEWQPLMQRLATTHRCIAPDYPGYGQSAEPPASFDYSLDVQVKFVDEIIAAMKIATPLSLVVHDTGGMSGTAWAAAHKPQLRGVVFTNTAVFEDFPWFPIAHLWGSTSTAGKFRASLGMQALGLGKGALFKRIFGGQSPQLSPEHLDRFARSFAMNPVAKRTALRQFRKCVRPEFFRGFDDMRLKLVEQVPCRVLWGDKDPYLTVDLSRRFGSARVTVLPEAGHWVPITAPDQLAGELRALA